MINKEAYQYYRLTESSYRALDKADTPYMNLGIWPAVSILEAQENLVKNLVSTIQAESSHRILELGPGWGGSRKIIKDLLPRAEYLGLNCSSVQINYAKNLNREITGTSYLHGFFEELPSLGLSNYDTVLALESLLHVEDKEKLITYCLNLGMQQFAFAEICLEDPDLLNRFPLFNPSLKYTWASANYYELFAKMKSFDVQIQDISDQVFEGWSRALENLSEIDFKGHSRVLKQFKESYLTLAELCREEKVKYLIIHGKANAKLDV